ncbi:hypothetical protein niasHT_035468 [Heterodera trifolii]|uniref:Uncharacterized protein n=1 Tax=Heterodera trifolii TaxID=157864 RepID=A0ABD2HZ23_9BILA
MPLMMAKVCLSPRHLSPAKVPAHLVATTSVLLAGLGASASSRWRRSFNNLAQLDFGREQQQQDEEEDDEHSRRAVRQRTDSSLPSVDEELTAYSNHNAKMRRTSSMPSVVESDTHGKEAFAVVKKGAIHRPIKHYNYEDRLSKLHKRALRFTWQRLQTRNGGKRIETVFEEVFDRMMRSFPVMREMFNTRTFISAMSRCEVATPRDHARLIVKMFESAVKNLEVEEKKRTDTASDFDPNLLGRAHGVLRPYGFTSALWEAFGEAVIDVVLNQEAVRDLPGASQAWVVLTACLVDQLRAGFESSRECPFQKMAQQQIMNGTGGAIDGTNTQQSQQQQLCRMKSDKSNKSEEEERAAGGGRDNEGFLAVNNTENRRNTIASCSDSPYSEEEEEEERNNRTTAERNRTANTEGGGTTTARRKSISRKRREQRCFSVITDKTGTPSKLEMKILHDMASTEL